MRWFLAALLLAGISSGCANVSRFEKGPLVAYGEQLHGAHQPAYYLIVVDCSKGMDEHILDVWLKLTPDAKPLQISELHPERVSQYLPRFVPPTDWPESWKKKANEEDAFSGGGFHIKFKNNQLQSVGICSHCAGGLEHPVIGTEDGSIFYTLPLTEQQLELVFGPPARVYKVHEVRY